MMLNEQVISAAQFATLRDLPEYAGLSVELVDGEIVTMSRPKMLPVYIVGEVYARLRAYALEHDGFAMTGEAGIVTQERSDGRDTVRGLDVGYIRKERLPPDPYGDFLRVAPDLVVEVLSGGNEFEDIDRKILEYQAMGVPLVWVIVPETRSVLVYQGDLARRYSVQQTLDGADVLPDLSIAVRDLFPPERG